MRLCSCSSTILLPRSLKDNTKGEFSLRSQYTLPIDHVLFHFSLPNPITYHDNERNPITSSYSYGAHCITFSVSTFNILQHVSNCIEHNLLLRFLRGLRSTNATTTSYYAFFFFFSQNFVVQGRFKVEHAMAVIFLQHYINSNSNEVEFRNSYKLER